MKKWSMFLAAAACACVLASPLQAAERKKVNISFPTAATTGALYPLGAGIANLWNTKLGYVNARVQASNGGIQNLNLLKAGDAQVSFAVSSITYEALHGQRGFKGRAYEGVGGDAVEIAHVHRVKAAVEADGLYVDVHVQQLGLAGLDADGPVDGALGALGGVEAQVFDTVLIGRLSTFKVEKMLGPAMVCGV